MIAIDADRAGRKAGRVLGERASSLGWHVFWAEPPDGLDWNDVLQRQQENGR
ncbi:toprim domain-containing protein [Aquabacter sp. L1I39]|uniref:toprim domain-containing protein n=1 Tax=Aquabacter sp. L1I39 TaxID=2820278 RepID=UPI001FFC5308|nr:toprim domain-containing protein [Aquabacter sp. L1I39]